MAGTLDVASGRDSAGRRWLAWNTKSRTGGASGRRARMVALLSSVARIAPAEMVAARAAGDRGSQVFRSYQRPTFPAPEPAAIGDHGRQRLLAAFSSCP